MTPEYYEPRRPTAPSWIARLPTLLLLAIVAVLVWKYVLPRHGPLHDPDAQARVVAPRGALASFETTTIEIFRLAEPSVVHIENVTLTQDRFTLDVLEIPRGTGTGFVWDARGYIVTNAHVVRGGNRFRVLLADHTVWEASLVGSEPDKDVAVLKIDRGTADALVPLTVGTSADLRVGQAVFAIGNPFGLDHTLTTGVISGLDRQIAADTGRKITGVIQTDAAINPGNSGGPLLDSAGRLIGMNTAILSPSKASAGIGFAVPVDTINRIVPRLIRGEKAPRAGFGVTLVPDEQARQLDVTGALVFQVLPDSAAEKAGLRATRRDRDTGAIVLGDVIVAIDGKPVKERGDLFDLLESRKVGERVVVTVLRDSARVDLPLTLQPIAPD
jgi:S1-C subfamily serine protease